jgi:hypothetical protein
MMAATRNDRHQGQADASPCWSRSVSADRDSPALHASQADNEHHSDVRIAIWRWRVNWIGREVI